MTESVSDAEKSILSFSCVELCVLGVEVSACFPSLFAVKPVIELTLADDDELSSFRGTWREGVRLP